jgi:hypothetical protein
VSELDGTWQVRRVSGALPPLHGVTKRIEGARGTTVLPGGAGIPFAVRGRELRYRPPFQWIVDVLEPHGDHYDGRTLVFGRPIGRFKLSREG